jgi:hypothetical protein
MESMSLVELKKLAKEKRIKQYYIMRRSQLIEILSLDKLPREFELQKKTIIELRKEARDQGLKGFWRLSRDELLNLLYPDPEKNDKNDDNAKKHDEPKSHYSENIWIEIPEYPL